MYEKIRKPVNNFISKHLNFFFFFLKIEIDGEVPIKLICVTVSGPLITTQTGPNDV